MSSADRARLQIVTQRPAHFRGPADPEQLLEPSGVGATRRTQEPPEPETHVVQRALEILQSLDRRPPESQAHLDGPEGRVQSGHLLGKAGLRHRSSHS